MNLQMCRRLNQEFIHPHIKQHGADLVSGMDQQSFGFLFEAEVVDVTDADGVVSGCEIRHHVSARRESEEVSSGVARQRVVALASSVQFRCFPSSGAALALNRWMLLRPDVTQFSETGNIDGALFV